MRGLQLFLHEVTMAGQLLRPSVRAVFFDAVGTLIHPAPPAPEVYHAIAGRFRSRLSLDEICRRFRTAFQKEEALDQAAGLQTSEPREVERWRGIVTEVLDDVNDPAACFAELFEHFSRPEAWRCDPDAAETLQRLEKRGLQLGVASNFDQRLRRVAAGFEALRPLRHLVISSEVGWRKPAREFFAALCRSVELPPEAVLLVGDDVGNDYEGARAAGLQAVLFDPQGRAAASHDCRIAGLGELLKRSAQVSEGTSN
jgi:putative hydrolase of the HAD superfamily